MDVFDKPVRTTFVPLPKSPNVIGTPAGQTGRTCIFFKSYMVKQVDLGDLPVERLSLTPGMPGRCDAGNAGERDIASNDLWDSRFVGAKGPFALFYDVDGANGGMAFTVVHAPDGRSLFGDSFEDDPAADRPPFERATLKPGGGLVLRYLRNYVAGCSVYADRTCWRTIRRATGLTGDLPARCLETYASEIKVHGSDAGSPAAHTVLAYRAELRYRSGQVSIVPLSGVLRCRPSD